MFIHLFQISNLYSDLGSYFDHLYCLYLKISLSSKESSVVYDTVGCSMHHLSVSTLYIVVCIAYGSSCVETVLFRPHFQTFMFILLRSISVVSFCKINGKDFLLEVCMKDVVALQV